MRAKIDYQIATYSGSIDVYYDDPNTENEALIAKAKDQLQRRSGPLPFGYESFKVERYD